MVRARKETDDDDEKTFFTLKSGLRKIIIIAHIRHRSHEATKITHLGSLLFLNKIEVAFEEGNAAFFEQTGRDVIRECFMAVLNQHKNGYRMIPAFRHFVENLNQDQQFEWPTNNYFGNIIGDLIDLFETNTKNNLITHAKKRLTSFLKLRIHQNNQWNFIRYQDEDIKHTINMAIKQRDSIVIRSIEDVPKRARRDLLLEMIRRMSWFDIPNNDIDHFTKFDWFKSIQMWIAIQRTIDLFNTSPRPESAPIIKNLSVAPICGITRVHVPIDSYSFYKLLCGTGLIPVRDGKQITHKEVSEQL